MKLPVLVATLALIAQGAAAPAARAIEMPKKADASAAMGKLGEVGGLLAAAKSAGNLNTFLSAVNAAGLAEKLSGKGPFTVFAPTDEAFAKLPAGVLDNLMQPANKADLAAILGNHVVPGRLTAAEAITSKITTVNGRKLGIAVVGDVMQAGGANVVQKDIAADNGVIHAIDTVIIPADDGRAGPAESSAAGTTH